MLNLFVGLDIYTGLLLLLALAFVLFYEAINGFHDTANAVATVIYTRAMQPQLAVVMAAFFNFFGVLLGGLSVAYAIGVEFYSSQMQMSENTALNIQK